MPVTFDRDSALASLSLLAEAAASDSAVRLYGIELMGMHEH